MPANDIPAFMRPGQVLTDYSSVAIRVQATASGGMVLVAFGQDEMNAVIEVYVPWIGSPPHVWGRSDRSVDRIGKGRFTPTRVGTM